MSDHHALMRGSKQYPLYVLGRVLIELRHLNYSSAIRVLKAAEIMNTTRLKRAKQEQALRELKGESAK